MRTMAALFGGSAALAAASSGLAAPPTGGWVKTFVGGTPSRVRDVWAHADAPVGHKFSFAVPKHGVVLLTVRR